MLPVLILAASLRRPEHWQHAVETSALKLHLDPLRGALACLPELERAHENLWRLPWRTLSTNHLCHLRDLLRRVPPAVFPPFLNVEEDEEEQQLVRALPDASGASGSSEKPDRLVVGDLARRVATITQHDLEEREGIALLGVRLTSCQWSILRLVLAQAARRTQEQALCWWETGAACERRYRVGEQWHNLRPDALAEYQVGEHRLRFWLEWDRGTMNARDLAVKFASYAHYLASREWAREGAKPPWLLCVAPELAQERRMQRVAQASLTSTTELVLWTTTSEWLC